jgi:hypothetical protein
MRLLISTLLLTVATTAVAQAQDLRGVAGDWTVILEFPDLNIRETLALKFRPGVGLDPNGRLRRGFQAIRQRPELGSSRSTTYFIRVADRRVRMSVDREEMCDIVFDSKDSFTGRCNMIGIAGRVAARRSPDASQ